MFFLRASCPSLSGSDVVCLLSTSHSLQFSLLKAIKGKIIEAGLDGTSVWYGDFMVWRYICSRVCGFASAASLNTGSAPIIHTLLISSACGMYYMQRGRPISKLAAVIARLILVAARIKMIGCSNKEYEPDNVTLRLISPELSRRIRHHLRTLIAGRLFHLFPELLPSHCHLTTQGIFPPYLNLILAPRFGA